MKQKWDKRTAGAHMTIHVPTVPPHYTLKDVKSYITKNIDSLESVNYVYVLSEKGKLLGVFSIKEAHKYPPHFKASEIAKKDPITVSPITDQVNVSSLALKHNIKQVPVVDQNKRFLGAVLSDEVFFSIYKQMNRRIVRLMSFHKAADMFDSVFTTPISKLFIHRFPWLFIGMIGGVLAARIIQLFESSLEKNLILAAFIPLIVYMADAVGTQMEGFIIRDLAFRSRMHFLKYFTRQFATTTLIAIVCGVSLFFISIVFWGNVALALTLGISLFFAITSAIFSGLIVPFLLNKLKIDPAAASGPVATIIQDIVSVVIYFVTASVLLKY